MHEKQKNDSIERRINREPNIFRMFEKIDRSSNTEMKNGQLFIVLTDAAQRLCKSAGSMIPIIFLPYKGA